MDLSRYDLDCQKALQQGLTVARSYGHGVLEVEHVALALLRLGLVDDKSLPVSQMIEVIEAHLRRTPRIYGLTKVAFGRRLDAALDQGESQVDVVNPTILWSTLQRQSTLIKTFIEFRADLPKDERIESKHIPTSMSRSKEGPKGIKVSADKKTLIAQFTIDLSEIASRGELDPVIGRSGEVRRILEILGRRKKNNPLLIGDPGVGKSALVEGLALEIASGKVPETMRARRILVLDIGGLLAGTKYRGEFEERMKQLVAAAANEKGKYIFFIDEIHMIVGAGNQEGGADIANLLKPALARGDFLCLGATTYAEYRKYIEKDAALDRRFQSLFVEEPSRDDAAKILRGLRSKYEEHHKVTIADEAINAAVDLSIKYLPNRKLPDKAIDLIDEAASRASLEREPQVDANAIYGVVADRTRMPLRLSDSSESERLLGLEKKLSTKIFGQWGALRRISRAVRRARVGVGDPRRPWGSFLFLGPTGVGKTETAKALAEELFGEVRLIRLDMSEYMEEHSVARLIGAPPGYLGFGETGLLVEAIKQEPYSIVLFDEIEKAHPRILDILLQLLDEGRLTDSLGRLADFRSAMVILTSNIGVDAESSNVHEEVEYLGEDSLRQILSRRLRPELINRIDEIVVFRSLGRLHLGRVLVKLQESLNERLKVRKMRITLGPSIIQYLLSGSLFKQMGARVLQRAFTKEVVDQVSERILLRPHLATGAWIVEMSENGEVYWQTEWRDGYYLPSAS